jgi:hypothetical protein
MPPEPARKMRALLHPLLITPPHPGPAREAVVRSSAFTRSGQPEGGTRTRCRAGSWPVSRSARNRKLPMNLTLVGSSRRDDLAPSRGEIPTLAKRPNVPPIAPLNAARASRRDVPTGFMVPRRDSRIVEAFPMNRSAEHRLGARQDLEIFVPGRCPALPSCGASFQFRVPEMRCACRRRWPQAGL